MLKKPFVFDFDDAIFLLASSHHNSFIDRYKNPDKIAKIIKMSKRVIAGNAYLADFALAHNRSVSIIPTSIDTDKYCPRKNNPNKEVVIGWIGSITTLNFLNEIKKVFIRLSKEFQDIKLKFKSGISPGYNKISNT